MKIISIIKQVPDAEARIRSAADGISLEGVTFVIDGMDEYGVEQALRVKEGGEDAEIVVFALGPKRFEEAIRTALAMGADRAVHIETDEPLDPIAQAKVLANIISDEGADVVFVGGQEADWDSSALGPAVAEALGWAHSDWTTKLELNGSQATVTHDSDEGSEDLTLPLPLVITTQQGLNEPRYPTLPNIMKAKRKEMKKLSLEEVGGAEAKTAVVKQEIQVRERRQHMIEGDAAEAARELAQLLRDEAKVL